MDKKETALSLFQQSKFNCAQSVFGVFTDELGIDRDTALKTAAGFGGGMRCGEVCGAVTGALMALGVRFGSSTPNDAEGKQLGNGKAVEFLERFKEHNGTLMCRDILGYNPGIPEDMEKIHELGLHDSICPKVIADAVEIAQEMISSK